MAQRHGPALKQNEYGYLVIEYLRLLNLEIGNSVPIDGLMEYGRACGLSSADIESALFTASANGWVIATDHQVHLTKIGYFLLNPANDNVEHPHID
jgi:hypothetical protein